MVNEDLNYTEDEIDEIIKGMEDYEEEEKAEVTGECKDIPGFKIIKETDKTYKVQTPEGIFWICKECYDKYGKIVKFTQGLQVAAHYRKEHPELSGKREEYTPQKVEEPDYIPTVEEELRSMRARKLYELLSKAPGVDKRRVPWVCKVFEENKRLQSSPEILHTYLKKQFPKMLDDDIRYIVTSVYELPEETSEVTYYNMEENKEEKIDYSELKKEESRSFNHQFTPVIPSYTTFNYDPVNTLVNLIQQLEKLGIKRGGGDEEKAYLKAKLEFMEKEHENLRKQLNDMFDILKKGKLYSTTANEWTLMQDIIDKAYEAGSGIAKELAKLNRLLLTLWIGRKRGYTDEDILKIVEEEVGKEYIE